jgi:hypothetical protein
MVSGLTWMTKRRWPPRGRFSRAAQTKGTFPAIPDEAGTASWPPHGARLHDVTSRCHVARASAFRTWPSSRTPPPSCLTHELPLVGDLSYPWSGICLRRPPSVFDSRTTLGRGSVANYPWSGI